MRLGIVLGLIGCLTMVVDAHAQRKMLEVGASAPGLDIAEWVKGEETTIEDGSVYIVEFWATWCAPCRKSIPHLTELQGRYGDAGLTIIGVSDEEVDKVRPFVDRQGSKMDYTVAVDRREATKRAWFSAAGLKGIPAAFIVDRNGKIAYIGHPLDPEMDNVLARVMKGRFDPRLQREAEPVLDAARRARKVRNWRMAEKHYNDVIAKDPKVFADVGLELFEMYLIDLDDRERAYTFAREQLMAVHWVDDAGAMAMLAQKVAADPRLTSEMRDMDLALEAAEAGQALAGNHQKTEMLATLALVQFHRGDVEKAVQSQKRAYFLASEKSKPEYRRVLRSYQQAANGG